MGYLNGCEVYLSGPITFDSPDHNWRIDPKRVLTEEFGVDLFDPFDDPKQAKSSDLFESLAAENYDRVVEICRAFVRKDLSRVDRSDFVVAYLPYKVSTIGTHHEIIYSNDAKKPTLLVADKKNQIPPWYFGFIPTEFMFGGWDALYDYLREVNEGKHKDNFRWAYTYGLI